MIQGITTFLQLTAKSGVTQGLYQNSQIGETIRLNGVDHNFLSFIYKGAARNRTGDNIESELILANNQIAMNIASEAISKSWVIQVDTVSMHPETFAVGRVLGREIWRATGLAYDPETLIIRLSSAIDAVGGSAPTRTLTETLVGQLPITASIRNS